MPPKTPAGLNTLSLALSRIGTLDGLTGFLKIARSIRGTLTAAGMPRSRAAQLVKVIAGFCLLSYMAEQSAPNLAEVNELVGTHLDANWSWVKALQFFADFKAQAPIAQHAELIQSAAGVAMWHATYQAIGKHSETQALVRELIGRFGDHQSGL